MQDQTSDLKNSNILQMNSYLNHALHTDSTHHCIECDTLRQIYHTYTDQPCEMIIHGQQCQRCIIQCFKW